MHFSLYLTAFVVQLLLPGPAEKQVPARNQQLIDYARKSGRKISPTYEKAVCTEFLIAVLQNATTLSARDKKRIRIQTKEPLAKLIRHEDSLIRGVQWALVSSGKGKAIPLEEVLPGDLVQYWDSWAGIIPFGHCGIVTGISPGKSIRLISSSPHTDGYGEMDFPWPEKMFFVRLK
jgi:hypothetical protein